MPHVAQENPLTNEVTFDFIAVGVGPFNLGLAALTSTINEINGLFLDRRDGFDWHPGLMMEGVHLQTPFLSDLVTLADPTHPLSFLNYIKKQGRIYSFYIREDFFLLRQEYNQYCQWAAGQIDNICWQQKVDAIHYNPESCCYEVEVQDALTASRRRYRCRKIVLGTGQSPHWPQCSDAVVKDNPNTLHAADYLSQKQRLQSLNSITIIGSGQSAAEIFYDLLQDIDDFEYSLNWVTSAPRFFPLEYTKLTLEMTSPEYVDYFYNLPGDCRDELIASQKNLYKGINSSLINEIYDLLYVKRLSLEERGRTLPVNIHSNSKLVSATEHGQNIYLQFDHREQNKPWQLQTEGLVLATGYGFQQPRFLAPITSRIQYDQAGRFQVQRNYSIDAHGGEIYVQNAELHSHGFVTPDLGMACYRNSQIIKEITGIEYYPIEQRIAFQEFGPGAGGAASIGREKQNRELKTRATELI